jgi:hypothetical protein
MQNLCCHSMFASGRAYQYQTRPSIVPITIVAVFDRRGTRRCHPNPLRLHHLPHASRHHQNRTNSSDNWCVVQKQLNNEHHRKHQAQLVKKTLSCPAPQPQPQSQPRSQPYVIPSYGTVKPSPPVSNLPPPTAKLPRKKSSQKQKQKQHVRRQSEDVEDPHYTHLRERARTEGDEVKRCAQESQKAYAFRDKRRAKRLSEEKKAHEIERDRLNAEASAWIYSGA